MKGILKIVFLGLLFILIVVLAVYQLPTIFQGISSLKDNIEGMVWGKAQISDNFSFQDKQEKEKTENNQKQISYLERLTLEQKIGQLFIIGFEGKVLTPEIENLIKKTHPGGILLLERNIEDETQLKELVISLQKISLEDSALPLFIVIDQEGGPISRIKWLEDIPQSEIENPEEAYQIGKNRAKELKKMGINLNLAPLLDLASSGDFIYQRCFQKSPETIGELAKALIRGQKEAGLLTAIKHFPGYQGISFNPEERLAILEEIPEISQFQKTIKGEPEMIMLSNAVYNEIDKKLPFGFLAKGIQFLKEKLDDEILIISDDLAQNSLLDKFSLNEIVSLPIKAGLDILIFSGWRIPAEKGVSALQEAVKNNQISEERINQSFLKIIKLKEKI